MPRFSIKHDSRIFDREKELEQMEVNQALEHIQQHYKGWKFERDMEQSITDLMDIQNFLASFMYEYAKEFINDKNSLKTFINGLYGLEKVLGNICSLDRFKRIYEQLDMLEEPHRTSRLSKLMSEMEREFNIPMLNNEQFNRENIEVMELYWEISYARDL